MTGEARGKVLLFGRLKDAFGAATVTLPAGVETAADLRARLRAEHPHLDALLGSRTVRIAVNQELAVDEAATRISEHDEIALMPPLSGG